MHDLTQLTPFERRLTDRLAVELDGAVLQFDPQAIADRAMRGRRSLTPRRRLVLLAAAALLLVGGVVAVGSGLIRVPWFHEPPLPWPLQGVLERAGILAIPEQVPMTAVLDDGRVLIVTPELTSGPNHPAEIWDPATGSLQRVGVPIKAGDGSKLVVLLDGRVLVVGGDGVGWPPTAEIFDPATGTFSALQSRPSTIDSTPILLRDGRVLLSGGAEQVDEKDDTGDRGVASRAEVFDPITSRFTPVGDMHFRRLEHQMFLLRDGRVLVLGGSSRYGDGRNQPTGEIFDPVSGAFAVADRPPLLTYTGSARLPDGRLMVLHQPAWGTFGDFPSQPMTVTFYDLETRLGTPGPTIPASAPVYDVRTVLPLSDSRVLLSGFDKASYGIGQGGLLDRGWLGVLDLETGRLSPGIVREASWGTAVALRDGRVLIVGGTERTTCAYQGRTFPCMESSSAIDVLR